MSTPPDDRSTGRALDADERAAVLRRPAQRPWRSSRDARADRRRRAYATAMRRLREYTRALRRARLEIPRGRRRPSSMRRTPARPPHDARALDRRDRQRAPLSRGAAARAPLRMETIAGRASANACTVPIDAVGLYVPAGRAPLPSTAIMLAVPARIAGCPVRVMRTPPRPDGAPIPPCSSRRGSAASTHVFKLGGAQAIAAHGLRNATRAQGRQDLRSRQRLGHGGEADRRAAIREGAALRPAGGSLRGAGHCRRQRARRNSSPRTSWRRPNTAPMRRLCSSDLATPCRAACVASSSSSCTRLPRRAIADACARRKPRASSSRISPPPFEVSNRYAPEHLILQVSDARALAGRSHATPAPCSWAPGHPKPWAITAAAPITCCRPMAMRAPTAGSRRRLHQAITVQELTPAGLRSSARRRARSHDLEGLDAHARRRAGVALEALEARSRGMKLAPRSSHAPTSATCSLTSTRPGSPTLERMHANELPWRAQGDNTRAGLNRYPEPQPPALVERLAHALRRARENRAGRARQRRSDRPAGARVLPRRRGQRHDLSTDFRLLHGLPPGSRAPACVEVPLDRARGFQLDVNAVIDAGRSGKARLPVLAEQSDRQPARARPMLSSCARH